MSSSWLQNPIFDILRDCTVRIDLSGKHSGTGFFITPEYLLTCAHVVEKASAEPQNISVYYFGGSFPVEEITEFLPKPYPDLALLRIKFYRHPCVRLDTAVNPFDKLYVFGYPSQANEGAPLTLEADGWEQVDPIQKRLKLKQGQVEGGFSGSPVLNLESGSVCGILKSSRHPGSDLGGWAIPMEEFINQFPDQAAQNIKFHETDSQWAQAWQQQLPQNPEKAYTPPDKSSAKRLNTRDVRNLIQKAFTLEELNLFIYDYFPDVKSKLTANMSGAEVAQKLIEYVDQRNQQEKLLNAIEAERPEKVQEFIQERA